MRFLVAVKNNAGKQRSRGQPFIGQDSRNLNFKQKLRVREESLGNKK